MPTPGISGTCQVAGDSVEFGTATQQPDTLLQRSAQGILQILGVGTAFISGALSRQGSVAGVGNTSTSETDLFTYTLPANMMGLNFGTLRVTAWGSLAANANTKTIKLYFGSATPLNASTSTSGGAWRAGYEVMRITSSTQVANGWNLIGTSFQNDAVATNLTSDLTTAITIKVTGQSNTASSDVLCNFFLVELLP